jgi:hypothetical protein
VHEFGHLLGLGHSPDPTDPMYATPSGLFPPCLANATRHKIACRRLRPRKRIPACQRAWGLRPEFGLRPSL